VALFYNCTMNQSSGSDESLVVGPRRRQQQHDFPEGPLVLRLGPGPSAWPGDLAGSQPGGGLLLPPPAPPPLPPPPLSSCSFSSSSSSSASLLLVAAPLPSQPISSRLVRGTADSLCASMIHPFHSSCPPAAAASSRLPTLLLVPCVPGKTCS